MTDDRLHRYATRITAGVDDPAVRAAFAAVPRELFVPRVIGADGGTAEPTPDRVYSDEALVTRVRGGWPSSSSSQPSLMARMLAALALRPGLRVLEIGAGTGYNAALIATITGSGVVSVDVQPEVVDEARAALARAGIAGVRVCLGDGYLGAAEHGPYDRIIATVGVGGVPPDWLSQLAPGGMIVAPIEHGGLQPCLAVRADGERAGSERPDGERLTGRGVTGSGFMLAAGGRLHPNAAMPPALHIPQPAPRVPIPPTPDGRYGDLWFGLAAVDPRVGRRPVPGYDDGGVQCVVTDPAGGAVLVERDALVPVDAEPSLVAHVQRLVEEWHVAGTPAVPAWRCGFRFAGGLWVPAGWRVEPG